MWHPVPIPIALQENASELGRKWLAAIPSGGLLNISDFDLAVRLCVRTLMSPTTCGYCAKQVPFLHLELCEDNSGTWIERHQKVKWAVVRMLETIPNITVEVEPGVYWRNMTPEEKERRKRHRRNDIRLSGNMPNGLIPEDYDVKVTSLFTGTNDMGAFQSSDPAEIDKEIKRVLAVHHRKKLADLRLNSEARQQMKPLMFSSGGAVGAETEKTIWRGKDWCE